VARTSEHIIVFVIAYSTLSSLYSLFTYLHAYIVYLFASISCVVIGIC